MDAASTRDRHLADHQARGVFVNVVHTAAANQTILIVDDHPSIRKLAKLALEADGFTVIGAVADGESALIETLRQQPDILLLDVGLPDMTGFEAASRLRDAASTAVIVLASARERSDFGPLIVESGANGFVSKEQLSGEMIRTEIAA
jgi:DNA-binding response OmpR family regulator